MSVWIETRAMASRFMPDMRVTRCVARAGAVCEERTWVVGLCGRRGGSSMKARLLAIKLPPAIRPSCVIDARRV